MEITLTTFGLLGITLGVDRPIRGLNAPMFVVYRILLVLSTLLLDARTSLVVGAAAGIQYGGLALALLALDPTRGADLPFVVGHPFLQVMKAILLAATGVGAAFVARELRLRLEETVAAERERGRMETTNRAKSVFLAHLSHEIRAPLNAMEAGVRKLLFFHHAPERTDVELEGLLGEAREVVREGGLRPRGRRGPGGLPLHRLMRITSLAQDAKAEGDVGPGRVRPGAGPGWGTRRTAPETSHAPHDAGLRGRSCAVIRSFAWTAWLYCRTPRAVVCTRWCSRETAWR